MSAGKDRKAKAAGSEAEGKRTEAEDAAAEPKGEGDGGAEATREAVAEAQAAQAARGGGAPQGGRPDDVLEKVADNAWLGIVLVVLAAIPVGAIQGAAAAILVLIAAALISVIALFWSSVRTLFGETPITGADAYALAAPRAEEEQKQAVLRALKDLEFERSVGKISDEHYAELVTRYRAEAKRLLRVLDEEASARRERVEGLVKKRMIEAGLTPPADLAADTTRSPAPDAKKKKKKGKGAEAEKPATIPSPFVEIAKGADREADEADEDAPPEKAGSRVVIEPIEEPTPPKERPKSIDITWKSPLPTRTKESPAFAPTTKKCAECGARNDADANFCKKCGAKAFEGAGAKAAESAEARDVRPSGPRDDGNHAADEQARDEASESADTDREEAAR